VYSSKTSNLFVTLAFVVGPGFADAAAQTCDSSPLLIRNTSVWTRDGLVANRDVVFRDGRVAAIEPSRASRTSSALRTIDGTGHTLLPGLVDAHLHFVIPGGLPRGTERQTEIEEITGRQLLRSGVTSGRLHLATIEEAVRLKTRSANACEPFPLLQVGGPGLSGAAERDFGNFQGAKSPEDAIEKIGRFAAAGIDWVAVHDADRFAPPVLEAIAAAVRRNGMRLMASGSTPAEIAAALKMNPDTLDYFDRTPEPRYAASTLDSIRARRELVLVPTPGVPYRTGQYLQNPALVELPENFQFLGEADKEFVIANARKDLAGPPGDHAKGVLPFLPEKLRQLRELGLAMAVGSDAGSQLQFQAGAIWWELESWRALGAPHREALIAATEGGARVLRVDDVGRLTPGSRADFVLYRGDVESGPFDAARVLAVGKAGAVHYRAPSIGPTGHK
jgi:cytosine/adenosine deaminase-related metal-dependent hydrolase